MARWYVRLMLRLYARLVVGLLPGIWVRGRAASENHNRIESDMKLHWAES
jgi:hypothetical protein